jgi:hypothetical protein
MAADQLATPQDLASLLQLTYTSLTAAQQATLLMLVELATAKVQGAAGQRIVEATDTALIDVEMWECDQYLPLPQMPVRSVATVLIDGVADTSWRLRKQMLWRLNGWNINGSAPTQVAVTSTHGYPSGAQALQLGKNYTLALARTGWGNTDGVVSEAIDDYRVTFAEADARMQVPDSMADSIRAAYGISAFVTSSRD